MTTSIKQGSVGVDGSLGSDAGLGWTMPCATTRRKPLVILNVVSDPALYTPYSAPAEPRQRLQTQARGITDHVIGSRGRPDPRVLVGSISRIGVERAHSTVVVVQP